MRGKTLSTFRSSLKLVEDYVKVSEKTLNKLKIGLRAVHSNLNVSSYSSKGLSINVCPHCLLKSFEVNYSTLKDIEFSRNCRCYLKRLYGNNKC